MRVLDTRSGQFVEIDPRTRPRIAYAILSHTWDAKEQTYQELEHIQKRSSTPPAIPQLVSPPNPSSSEPPLGPIWDDPELSPKISEACRVARENGYRYLWIDSCCIDKTSSSELSESINSMYQWYTCADVCYAFLPDVPAGEDHWREGSRFRGSRWFTRGWTLQELIAPLDVRFLSMEWTFIGSKNNLADLIVEITKIHYNALLNIESLDVFSVAQRFSWASRRETTRVEDRAYCLLGIFGINMPTLYGEGKGAFRRLQEEIMQRTPDQSLFAWTRWRLPGPLSWLHEPVVSDPYGQISNIELLRFMGVFPFLALSPDIFKYATEIRALPHDEVARRLQLPPNELPTADYAFTPYGIRTQLPVMSFSDYFPAERARVFSDIPLSQWYLVILACGHQDFPGHLIARPCYSSGSSIEFLHPGNLVIWMGGFDILPLSPAAITHFRSSGGQISIKTLYIPQPHREQGVADTPRRRRHETIKLVLPEKTLESLSAQGYTVTLRSPDDAHPRTHSVVLSHNTHAITIDYQHTLEERLGSQELTIEAHVKTSGLVRQGTPGDLRQADGHGSRVLWRDWGGPLWSRELPVRNIRLDIFNGGSAALTARLGLTFGTTDHYLLHIELKTADRS